MATSLPVPLEFRLPDGWEAVQPDAVGAPDSAFVARRPRPGDTFVANITIGGYLKDPEIALTTVADEVVERLQEAVGSVDVRNRTEIGSPQAPGLVQVVELTAEVNGSDTDLVQCQTLLSMPDRENPANRAVIELVLTSTPGQLEGVLPDFQYFVSTVRPDAATE
ncbi:hypothetical protein D5S17_33780 [Pseudonocardiaceae bacterium YIM PH 21723]|nr:hypothetical protein D5S17_33780 [Pseudonocardiaceae bacterium YIM PH 21723]